MKMWSASKEAAKLPAFSSLLFLAYVFLAATASAQYAYPPDRQRATTASSPVPRSLNEQALFESLNQERASHGLTALHWDARLADAAQLHAQRMADTKDLSHQLPGEPELLARLSSSGARFTSIAENIAEGPDVEAIHDGWMHSPGHRANILNPQNTAVGIAVVQGSKQLFAVQDFSRAVEDLDLTQQEKKVSALLSAHGLHVEKKVVEARRNCDADFGISGVTVVSLIRFDSSDLNLLPEGVTKTIRSRSFRDAAVGACPPASKSGFASYRLVILLF